jgi:NhaP-type Na+/H+ or K+/H+ antiporter
MLAAAPGFDFGDPYLFGLLFAGLALFAAVGALSHHHERAFSASLVYLALGLVAAVVIDLAGIDWLDPLADSAVFERASELAIIVAVFAAGLKLERELSPRGWAGVARLLLVAMPVTIGAVALLSSLLLGLSLGAAIILGACLAPTDPVLAGDLGVGPPGDEEEHEPNFSVTGEAGLNDGLAFPFVLLGVFVARDGGTDWLGTWLAADVLYGIGVALAAGAALGYGIAALAVFLRDRGWLSPALDGWLAIAAVLVIYGATEALSALGFVAAFAGGVAFRRYEHGHEYNRRVHAGAEMVEKFGELALVLLLGSTVTLAGLQEPGVAGWLLAGLLLFAVRPVAVAVALAGTDLDRGERAFVGWFGVRGIGSLYYASVAIGLGVLSADEAGTIFWTVAVCILVSIVLHGVTASALSRRWLGPQPTARGPGSEPRGAPAGVA